MKFNQRYDIDQISQKQNSINSKVYANYLNHFQQLQQETNQSFNSIETPGWTSLAHTQQSQSKGFYPIKTNLPNQSSNPHSHILSKLNSLPKLNSKTETYSKIRLDPSITKNKNVFIYSSLKAAEKKNNQKPTLRNPKLLPKDKSKALNQSNRSSSKSNKFLNRFSTGKHIFQSKLKSQEYVLNKDSRKRISSVKSQPHLSLTDRIKERLSLGNHQLTNITSDFESNINTQSNQNAQILSKRAIPTQFYSKIHATPPIKQQKHEYMIRYLNKLNHRTTQAKSVKIFKKPQLNTAKSNKDAIRIQQSFLIQKENDLPLTHKRFNSITVHDHLYQNAIKIESKKQMQKMIDQSYQRVTTLTFSPFVSLKSNYLAESKYSNLAKNQNRDQSTHHHNCLKKQKNNALQNKESKRSMFSIQEQVTFKQKQKLKDQNQNFILLRLFMILSNGANQINDKNLEINIEKLPLPLIELLQPILAKIYSKQRISQEQFFQLFQASRDTSKKQIILKKPLVLAQAQRYLKNEKRQKQNFGFNSSTQTQIFSKLVA